MRKTISKQWEIYSSKMLKDIAIAKKFSISNPLKTSRLRNSAGVIMLLFALSILQQLFLTNTTFAAAPTATIGTSTTSSVAQSITPTDNGQLGTNQAATVQYSTTCKNTNSVVTIYISSSSPALTGSGTANGSTIPASSNTTAGSLIKDTWGYSLNNNTSSYLGGTTSNVEIASLTPNAAGNASNTKTIYYNANVSTAKPSGTYSTTVTYTALLNDGCNKYTINYDGNTSFGANGTTGSTSATTANFNGTTSLASNGFSKTGYTFQGWAKSQDNANKGTVDYNAGTSYSYSDSTLNPNGEASITVYAVWAPTKYTCTKRYRLENADGTWGSYITDTTEQVAYGSTCSYSKSVTNYKSSATGTNSSTASTSSTMGTSSLTLSLDLYRNTYTLTVNRNSTYISAASASATPAYTSGSTNYYRWGQEVSVSATLSNNSYLFNGWSVSSGSGTLTNPYTASTIFTTGTSNTTIYADGKSCSYSSCLQQTSTITTCNNLAVGSTMTSYDNRDGNLYTIGKLADGQCWMLQNLRIINRTIYPVDSNFTSKASYAIPASTATGTSTGFDDSTGYTTSAVYAPASNSGAKIYSGSDTSSSWTTTTDTNNIGVLYNYYTATADTISGSSNSTAATEDICPKGWHLPSTNSAASDFGALAIAYGGNTDGITGFSSSTDAYKKFNNAFKTVLAGYYTSGLLSNSGSSGSYWSSTASSTMRRYFLGVYSSDVYPVGNNGRNRYVGQSVRCVANPMQSTTTIDDCKAMTAGQTMTTVDKRDGSNYTIGKLADGKCWMLQNLRLGGNSAIALTSSDTNISASWTMPALSISTPDGNYDTAFLYQPTGTAKIHSNSAWVNTTSTTDIGILYNFAAASAGTITGSGNSSNASYDICPKGWSLPSKANTRALIAAYGNGRTSLDGGTTAYINFNNAFRSVLAGTSEGVPGSLGCYWTSTSVSYYNRVVMDMHANEVNADADYGANLGVSIRCVAK